MQNPNQLHFCLSHSCEKHRNLDVQKWQASDLVVCLLPSYHILPLTQDLEISKGLQGFLSILYLFSRLLGDLKSISPCVLRCQLPDLQGAIPVD